MRRPPVRAPGPPQCVLCEAARPHRRGLCWTCYRKLREAKLPLPLRVCDLPGDPLRAWVSALTRRQAAKLWVVLRERLKPAERVVRPDGDPDQLQLWEVRL